MAIKEVNITLQYDELLYDIQNRTYLLGRGREGEKPQALTQSTDDAESLNPAKRYVDRGLSMARDAVSEWCPYGAIVADNRLGSGSGSVTFTLRMPTNYNDGSTPALAAAIHDYVASSTIAEWLNDVSPNDASRYTLSSAEALAKVKEAVLSRKRPERRLHPVGNNTITPGSGGSAITELYLWLDNVKWNDNSLWLEHA